MSVSKKKKSLLKGIKKRHRSLAKLIKYKGSAAISVIIVIVILGGVFFSGIFSDFSLKTGENLTPVDIVDNPLDKKGSLQIGSPRVVTLIPTTQAPPPTYNPPPVITYPPTDETPVPITHPPNPTCIPAGGQCQYFFERANCCSPNICYGEEFKYDTYKCQIAPTRTPTPIRTPTPTPIPTVGVF